MWLHDTADHGIDVEGSLGTTSVTVSSGVASFGNLSINKAGSGYTLTAGAGSLTGATSDAFTITAGKADHLAFAQQPTDTTVNTPISPAVMVQVLDANGNLVTGDNSDVVALTLANNPTGATLGGTTSVTVSNGVATFSNLTVNLAGTGYTLGAGSGSLGSATSAGFNVSNQTTIVVSATDVPQWIDPLDLFTISSVSVSQSVTIASVKVQLNISYPYDGDLTIDLIAPDGTDVALSSFEGTGADFQDTIFDDAAPTPISAGDSPFAGSYQPESPLGALTGKNAQGTWQLEIIDWGGGFGTLNAWKLTIQPAGSAPARLPGGGPQVVGGPEAAPVGPVPAAAASSPSAAPASLVMPLAPAAVAASVVVSATAAPPAAFGSPGLVVAQLSAAPPSGAPAAATAPVVVPGLAVRQSPAGLAVQRPAESARVESSGTELPPPSLPGPDELPVVTKPAVPEAGPTSQPPAVDSIPETLWDGTDETAALPTVWRRACDACFADDRWDVTATRPVALAPPVLPTGERQAGWEQALAAAAVALVLNRPAIVDRDE
jgi:subtilisin-like proprotein convertase family protein